MIHVYGIKNCNTVKKALDWLNEHQIVSWEDLVNKKGTTWKKLSPEQQVAVVDDTSAREVLLQNNSMIKRPVIELEKDLILGFNEETYNQKIATK